MKNKSNKSESTILRQMVDELIIANKELAFQNEEKEKREEASKESEERYRNIFESTMIGIYRTSPDGRILLANPMLVNMLGYDTFENLAQRNLEKEGFEPRNQRKEFIERIERDGYIIGLESAWKKEDGTTIFIRENAKVFRDGAGNVLYYDGTIEDITERKQAEEALQESEHRYYEFIEQVRDAVFSVSPQGLLVSLNKAFEHITGWQVQEWIGKPFIDIIHPEDIPLALNRVSTVLNGQNADAVELRIRKKSGDYVVSEILATAQMKNGMTIGLLGIGRDITDRKRVEKELILAKEHAEESDRLKSAFLANMSHEIRTPMNGILGFSQLLKEPNLTGEVQQEYISMIEKSGARMLNIIYDIVDIAKIESGQMEIAISETNINEQIEFIYTFFKPEVERKGLQFLVKNALSLKETIIKTDREKIYAILTNLVNNAVKFTHTGSIEFGFEKKGKYLEFFVKDTGEGISDEQKEIIFERFRQGGDLTSRFNEGAGLGLSISKAYVEMLGGKIWVESELGKGSIFYFTIPYNAETQVKIVGEGVTLGIATDNKAKNLKILIAEDDETSEMFISMAVKMFGKEFLKAGTGVEAIEVCRSMLDIDLVLMDINMPEMDGYEATRQIRQFNKDVVIIAQTAYGLTGDREKAIEAGCNDYISKPIKLDVLRELIQKYFRQ